MLKLLLIFAILAFVSSVNWLFCSAFISSFRLSGSSEDVKYAYVTKSQKGLSRVKASY